MNRYGLFAIGSVLIFAAATSAVLQQNAGNTSDVTKEAANKNDAQLPSVEEQLKVLTEKIGLTSTQQEKVRTILKELHQATERIAQDKSLSYEEQLAKVRPERYKADEKLRALLSDEQRKKLDAYEQGPHPEMHGKLTGKAPSH